MRRIAIALLILSVLAISSIPLGAADADTGNDTTTVRWNPQDLYHATAVAVVSGPTADYEWVYPVGGDGSMRSFIGDIHSTPLTGLKQIEAGKEYEVYYFVRSGNFDIEKDTVELPKSEYKITVDEATVKLLTVKGLQYYNKSGTVDAVMYLLQERGSIYRDSIHALGFLAKLNYDAGCYYTIAPSTTSAQAASNCLYYEATVEIGVKEFHGSPYLYIGLSTAIVILVGLTVFICGRRPKFD